MEIKVNREIRDHSESLILGLSLRQLIFSALAILVAIGVYFLLREPFPLETLSWLCILCAAPFAALGFVKFNGLNATQLIVVIVKYLLTPKLLLYKTENYYEKYTEEVNAE